MLLTKENYIILKTKLNHQNFTTNKLMENKPTAIQELISEMEELKKTKLYDTSFKAIDDCIALAYNKLAMEKEQIRDAFEEGYLDIINESNSNDVSEQYYQQTYEK